MRWQATIHSAWGTQLMDEATAVPPDPESSMSPPPPPVYSTCGRRLAHLKLSRLENATTATPSILLAAAEAFSQGHDYERGVRCIVRYS
ncbi:MAG: hypothetical protein R3B96_09095 [Pirellulaceae bacterium]